MMISKDNRPLRPKQKIYVRMAKRFWIRFFIKYMLNKRLFKNAKG